MVERALGKLSLHALHWSFGHSASLAFPCPGRISISATPPHSLEPVMIIPSNPASDSMLLQLPACYNSGSFACSVSNYCYLGMQRVAGLIEEKPVIELQACSPSVVKRCNQVGHSRTTKRVAVRGVMSERIYSSYLKPARTASGRAWIILQCQGTSTDHTKPQVIPIMSQLTLSGEHNSSAGMRVGIEPGHRVTATKLHS